MNNIDKLHKYNVSDLFSLYYIIDYAIKDLWEDEFNTVTWLDLYKDWYILLNQIKKKVLEAKEKWETLVFRKPR